MDNNDFVECDKHGKTPPGFVCEHLLGAAELGFHVGYTGDDGDELYPDAWCDQCESAFHQHGEWNDENEPNISLVCGHCFNDICVKNWLEDEKAYSKLISESHSLISTRQDDLMEKYKLGEHDRYDYDAEKASLTFSTGGQVVVEANIDFVGTYSLDSKTWMWAWGNHSLPDSIKTNSLQLRSLGFEKNIRKLAMGHWPAEEVDCWEVTSIMANHMNAKGVYRAVSEELMTFMVISEIKWVKKKRFGIF